MPAIYDLANRGLLPPGFSLVGFARRDWADQDFAQVVHDAVKEHARTPFREDVWQQLARGHPVRARRLRRRRGVRPAAPRPSTSSTPSAAPAATTRSTSRSRRSPSRGRAPAEAHRAVRARRRPGERLAPGRDREAVRARPGQRPGAQRDGGRGVPARARSSGSTTTWARRRSRTSWRCGSPTRCSSRSGTATTSTTCRSRWPRTSASAAGPATTTASARPAT